MVKQAEWEHVQAPVAGPGPDCGPECSVCGWGDGQDGYGLPHALHTCVHIRDRVAELEREVELLTAALRGIAESGRPDAWAPLSYVVDGGSLADMAEYAISDHEKRAKEGV